MKNNCTYNDKYTECVITSIANNNASSNIAITSLFITIPVIIVFQKKTTLHS
jgi:hypothetical protein